MAFKSPQLIYTNHKRTHSGIKGKFFRIVLDLAYGAM
jgi:hypothetical protein